MIRVTLELSDPELLAIIESRGVTIVSLLTQISALEAAQTALHAQLYEQYDVVKNHQQIIGSLLGGPERTEPTVDTTCRLTEEQLIENKIKREAEQALRGALWEREMAEQRQEQEERRARCLAEDKDAC
jgi:hypothetical protein